MRGWPVELSVLGFLLMMQFRNETRAGERDNGENSFVIGLSLSFKPTTRTRLDLAPLFGVTHDSPRLQAFVVFSAVFGRGGEGGEPSRRSPRATGRTARKSRNGD